jgi:type II secretory pathway component GspD/PulD (secretin)
MQRRTLALAAALGSLSLLGTGCGSTPVRATPAASTQPAQSSPDDQVELISLRYALASDCAERLRDTVGSRHLRVGADERTNSVVLVGPRQDVERAKQLLAKLDIEVPAAKP